MAILTHSPTTFSWKRADAFRKLTPSRPSPTSMTPKKATSASSSVIVTTPAPLGSGHLPGVTGTYTPPASLTTPLVGLQAHARFLPLGDPTVAQLTVEKVAAETQVKIMKEMLTANDEKMKLLREEEENKRKLEAKGYTDALERERLHVRTQADMTLRALILNRVAESPAAEERVLSLHGQLSPQGPSILALPPPSGSPAFQPPLHHAPGGGAPAPREEGIKQGINMIMGDAKHLRAYGLKKLKKICDAEGADELDALWEALQQTRAESEGLSEETASMFRIEFGSVCADHPAAKRSKTE